MLPRGFGGFNPSKNWGSDMSNQTAEAAVGIKFPVDNNLEKGKLD